MSVIISMCDKCFAYHFPEHPSDLSQPKQLVIEAEVLLRGNEDPLGLSYRCPHEGEEDRHA